MKMKNTLFAITSGLLLFTACSEEAQKATEPKTSSYCNTEQDEWGPFYNLRKNENAHSGKTTAFVDSSLEYSFGYSKLFGDITKGKIDSVAISYWVYFKNDKAKARTVLSIQKAEGEKPSFWMGNDVQEKIKEYNKWMQVREVYNIPQGIDPQCMLKAYVWNNSKEEILLDDFKIDFY